VTRPDSIIALQPRLLSWLGVYNDVRDVSITFHDLPILQVGKAEVEVLGFPS
jgi:hypothetical protein